MKRIMMVSMVVVLFALLLGGCAEDYSEGSEGWCACSYNSVAEKCILDRNKCKPGFKPKCYGPFGPDNECECECVQK